MNANTIRKEIDKLHIPKEYYRINLDEYLSNDYYMMLSIRQDAGKTTSWLLTGLVCYKLYGYTIEYLRSDTTQIVRASTETMFDVIKKFNYIAKIFNGKWNDIEYKPHVKKWYLCYRDTEGNIEDEDTEPCCVLHAIEKSQDIKSTYNNPVGNFIIFDEFMDTNRSSSRQMNELQDCISTIGRYRDDAHVAMLGNNTNRYCFWFEEFCIENEIETINFGGYLKKKSELGTTLFAQLLDVSEKKKEQISKKIIRFTGFNTPKMNAFNGLEAWRGDAFQHIPDDLMLSKEYLITQRIYIKHRNRYVQFAIYQNDVNGVYVYLHYASKPIFNDNIIMTLTPLEECEVYGYGKFEKDKVKSKLYKIWGLYTQNKFFYASNSVGELIDDYIRECGKLNK